MSLLQIALILNRSLATEYKDTIEEPFCNMLKFFMIFCAFDIGWGLFFSREIIISRIGFTIISYGYHSMGALSAFIWYGYVTYYTKVQGRDYLILNICRDVLFVIQIILLGANLWTHEAFLVHEDGSYTMGSLRPYLYLLQFSYYIILLIFCLIKIVTDREQKVLYRNAIFFSMIPLMFGIGQYIFYDAAMYAFGFMLSAFIIYSFNLTAQREAYLTEQTTKLSVDVYIDALTGLYNRRAYEDDLEKYPDIPTEENFTYLTLDVNGLKLANDRLGHDAGDELIEGVAFCMRNALGAYGKLYRIGGDEFAAMIFANDDKLSSILLDFDKLVLDWKGKKVSELSVSYGYATKRMYPESTVLEIARIADKKMYQAKAEYYSCNGTDRRGQQEAFSVISQSYTKILRVNLTEDTYSIIQMDKTERDFDKGYDTKISSWLLKFATAGLVHVDDRKRYLEQTRIDNLRYFFKENDRVFCIYYRRLIGEEYCNVMMEMIRAREYTDDNQIVFLYVKNIER